MATKEASATDGINSHCSSTNDTRYTNFNLNRNHQSCPEKADIGITSAKNNEKTTNYCNDNSAKSSSLKWNSDERRSLKILEMPQPSVYGSGKDKRQELSSTSNSKTGSSLSLHIASYEAAQAAVDLVYSSDESSPTKSRLQEKKRKIDEEREKQRIPRHQSSPPFGNSVGVMQFQTSNKLFTPTSSKPQIRVLTPGEIFIRNRNRKRRHPDNRINENLPTVFPTTTPPSAPPPPPPPTPPTPPPLPSSLPPPPSGPSSSSVNVRKSYIAPTLPRKMTPSEVENYEDEDPEFRKWAKQYLNPQEQHGETIEEEVIRLREENKNLREITVYLRAENTGLKDTLKKTKASVASQHYRDKKKAEKLKSVAEPAVFESYHPHSQNRIVDKIWKSMADSYGESNASEIVSKLHQRKCIQEKTSLTPLQTLKVLKTSGVTIESFRKIRSALNNSGVHNPFASDHSVNGERAKIHDKVKTITKTVLMEGKNGEKVPTEVHQIESVKNELIDRLTTLVKSDNYEPFMNNGVEEVPCVFTGDKADDITTVVMGIGTTKNPRNSPKNCSLLGYFKASDSQANLYAAFGDPGGLAEQIDNIKELEIEIDGVIRKFKIRWFVLGDFKFLNAIAGLNSNSASFPCWGCEQKQETTYGNLNLTERAPERTMGINKNVSQIRQPLFKTIPFDHFIPPILHITLGPGAQLFEGICERAREMDNAKLDDQNIPNMLPSDNVRKSWNLIKENVEKLKDEIEQLNSTKNFYLAEAGEARHVCDSTKCFALRADIEVQNIFSNDQYCIKCSSNFHKCCLNKGYCPYCTQKFPTLKQSQALINKEAKEIDKKLNQTTKLLKEEEEKANGIIAKYKLGRLASNVEKVYEKFGGSRKAFFQEFTGKQLNKMGTNIHGIFCSLDDELKNDPKIKKIIRAIIQFFNIKKMLTTAPLDDSEIKDIDDGIKDFAEYMTENLPDYRVKQKGHVFFKHLPEFIKKFRIAAYFTDECIESFHVIMNKYKKRFGNRKGRQLANLLFKYTKEDTWLHDTFTCC